MELFYDKRDDPIHEARGSQILYWLDDLDAKPLSEARASDRGFLFAGARTFEDYRRLIAPLPLIADRPEHREPLIQLDTVLDALATTGVELPQPRTWRLALDSAVPEDIQFPLFVRTAATSWKRGGRQGRVTNLSALEAESSDLRRYLGWDALILAREWLELARAGESRLGPVPQEVRVWIVDGEPLAWSFHYLHQCPSPIGFPLNQADTRVLREYGKRIGTAFQSRLIAADFARVKTGEWYFIEAGAGSCAGAAHEAVFKAVARYLHGDRFELAPDRVGGPLPRV